MQEDTSKDLNLTDDLPIGWTPTTSSLIKVIGVGGGGSNAVSYMHQQGIHNVDFIICNTDAQALRKSNVPIQIRLGKDMTDGLGAGNKPQVGEAAALDSVEDIKAALDENTKMVFITAGMGGGTGTGAAPVIAKIAKEADILTVAIVTLPFQFEGSARYQQALNGIDALRDHVDSLLVINNEKLREMYGNLPISQAFSKADNVLSTAAKGIAELITFPGQVNVDFADVRTIMTQGGITVMGSASAEGENRALNAVEEALTSPLLNNSDIKGAGKILLNITSGTDENEITMDEFEEITGYVQRAVAKDALILWGTGKDERLGNALSVTIVATHFDQRFLSNEFSSEEQKRIPLSGKTLDERQISTSAENTIQGTHFTITTKSPSIDDILNRPRETRRTISTQNAGASPAAASAAESLDVDTLEAIPAFYRKQQREGRMNNVPSEKNPDEEVSQITLNVSSDYDVHLQEDNAYFSVPD